MERELEAILRTASARSLSATAGGVNYAAQARAVAAYIERLICAECRDDIATEPVLSVGIAL